MSARQTKYQIVLLEQRYYAACSLHYRTLCTGNFIDERIIRPATGFELQSGEGEEKIWNDDIVIFRTYQCR
jgi:hypothetical protein